MDGRRINYSCDPPFIPQFCLKSRKSDFDRDLIHRLFTHPPSPSVIPWVPASSYKRRSNACYNELGNERYLYSHTHTRALHLRVSWSSLKALTSQLRLMIIRARQLHASITERTPPCNWLWTPTAMTKPTRRPLCVCGGRRVPCEYECLRGVCRSYIRTPTSSTDVLDSVDIRLSSQSEIIWVRPLRGFLNQQYFFSQTKKKIWWDKFNCSVDCFLRFLA